MEVQIDNQTYQLRFGFGALRILGERFGLEDYSAVTQLIQEAFASFEKITFKQADVLQGLIVSAAIFADEKKYKHLEKMDVIDFMINDTETFNQIIQAVTDAFPKDLGKQQPNKQVRKTTKNQD